MMRFDDRVEPFDTSMHKHTKMVRRYATGV